MATMNVGVGEGDNGEAGDGRDVIERGIIWAGEKRGRAHVVWWRRVMKTRGKYKRGRVGNSGRRGGRWWWWWVLVVVARCGGHGGRVGGRRRRGERERKGWHGGA